MISYFLGDRDVFQDQSRASAWGLAVKYIAKNPILGCGHNSWYKIHGMNELEWLHNVFLELVLDQGLIGLILFVSIITAGFRSTKNCDRTFLILLLVFTSFPMFFQNGLYEVHFWRYIIINRLMMNFSTYSEGGITSFLNNEFGK